MIAVYKGGHLDLHGTPVPARWVRLLATATAGATTISVDAAGWSLNGWVAGASVLLASTTYNSHQTETMTIQSVAGNKITFTAPLAVSSWACCWYMLADSVSCLCVHVLMRVSDSVYAFEVYPLSC